MNDFIEVLFYSFCILLIFGLIILMVLTIIEGVKDNNLYQYECITLDNETITCDDIKVTDAGIMGKRDDAMYLIKQYKKIKKEE